MTTTPRAAIYVRVSTTAQEDGTSLETQEAACSAYAAQQGHEVAAVYREVHSGVELWERPQLTALREAVRRHECTTVIAHAIDRLARDPVHLGVIISEADHAGVDVLFVTEPLDNSPEGQLIRFVRGYAAKVEHAKIMERTQRGKLARVAAGKPLHGPRPLYGYQWRDTDKSGLTPNPTTAPVVQRIFREAVTGRTLRAIALGLAADAIASPTGNGYWLHTSIRRILENPAYAGEPVALRRRGAKQDTRRHPDPVALPAGVVPALIDRATFDQIDERLRLNQLRAVRNNHEPEAALLRGGFARCGYCGRSLTVVKMRYGHIYRCLNPRTQPLPCNNHSIMAHLLDAAVWEKVEGVLTRPELVAQELQALRQDDPSAQDLAVVDRALADISRRQRNLVDRLADEDDADLVAVVREKLAALTEQKRQLQTERDSVLARHAGWERAQQHITDIQAWCTALAEELASLDYTARRTALEALGVEARLFRQGDDPRYVITARVPLGEQVVYASTCDASGTCACPRASPRTRR